jgi:hypothetical protein
MYVLIEKKPIYNLEKYNVLMGMNGDEQMSVDRRGWADEIGRTDIEKRQTKVDRRRTELGWTAMNNNVDETTMDSDYDKQQQMATNGNIDGTAMDGDYDER